MAFLRDSSVYCIPSSKFENPADHKPIIASICMATSIIGFVGAALQLVSLWQYRDRQRRRPSAHPDIIHYLALSDLMACIGVFALAICFMKFQPPNTKSGHEPYSPENQGLYEPVVTIFEVIALYSYLASYIWTFSFALDMCFQVFKIECPMIVYHILAWLIPLDFVACVEGINFGVYGTEKCTGKSGRTSRLILSYILVMVVIPGNCLLYYLTYRKCKKLVRFSSVDESVLTKFKKKFFLMGFFFIVCWHSNIISVSIDLYKIPTQDAGAHLSGWRMYFVYCEALLNPLQGMFNYMIYRKSFKVTATDTRPGPDSLRVPPTYSYENYFDNHEQAEVSRNVSRTTNRHGTRTQPLESSPPCDPYIYTSKLLGERSISP